MVEALVSYEDSARIRGELSSYISSNLNQSSNAEVVFGDVYCKNLEDGVKETISDRLAAIALDVASADMAYFSQDESYSDGLVKVRSHAEDIANIFALNQFRVNTPTNINFGRWKPKYDKNFELEGYYQRSQLGAACFVVPIEDTFGESVEKPGEGILGSWLTQQMIHKGGGGTGFSFCRLRPKGSIIEYNPVAEGIKSIDWSTNRGVSSGGHSFLDSFYNHSTDAVKQGNSRRGANMGIQRIDHMDFLDHLFGKFGGDRNSLEYKLKNFNLSLAVTDEFMDAAQDGGTYTLFNPHRADSKIKEVLEKKHRIKDPEIVRKEDLATKEQFENILERNKKNTFAPITTPNMYLDQDQESVINAYNGEKIGTVLNGIVHINAAKILDTIAKVSYANGEPGIVFIDRMNEYNSNLFDGEIEATNPCGEQPLLPNEACNLGSINAGKFAKYATFAGKEDIDLESRIIDDKFTKVEKRKDGQIGVTYFDWNSLDDVTEKGVKILDNVVDRSDFPSQRIDDAVRSSRKIGLGYMGVADAMLLMKQRYGSDESLEFAKALAKRLYETSHQTSQKLAEERGVFPSIETSFHNPDSDLYKWFTSKPVTIPDKFRGERPLSERVDRTHHMNYGKPLRNSAITTMAPTGTIRRTSGEMDLELGLDNLEISSGIEPLFSLHTVSHILNTVMEDDSLAAVKLLKREGLFSEELMKAIKSNKGSVFKYSYTSKDIAEKLDTIPEEIRDVLVTAGGGEGDKYEITPAQHVKMLTTFQKYNDSAISKTINVPGYAKPEEIRNTFINMWKQGGKGGTIYRDQSREFQILNMGQTEKDTKKDKKFNRNLLQEAVVLETPYIGSKARLDNNPLEHNPDRCFTVISYDSDRGRITGVFQNVAEVDPERLSTMTSRNLEISHSFKDGRSLDDIIGEQEKIIVSGSRVGLITDRGAIEKSKTKDGTRHQIGGSTSTEGLLNTLYTMRFLTNNGKNFKRGSIQENMDFYLDGGITIKSIIATKGQITLEEKEDAMPSILGDRKAVKLPEGMPESNCPECL